MRLQLGKLGRGRILVSAGGSAMVHALVLIALVWVKAPSTDLTVKRGEPLFVELPEADEKAARGLPATPTPERRKAPAPPRAVGPARPAPPRVVPPVTAKASPGPLPRAPSTPLPTPVAPIPAPPLPRAEASVPVQRSEPSGSVQQAEASVPAERAEASVPVEPRGALPEPAGPKVAMVPPTAEETVPDLRSALRSGRGAGGSGHGQRGVYGEPVPLETKDPKYVDYFARIRRMIEAKWFYPCPEGNPVAHDCTRRDGQLLAEIGIGKNGDLSYLVLEASSGSLNMDEFALTAVKLAAPFPPVPESVGDGVGILVSFRYVLVDSSITNLLR